MSKLTVKYTIEGLQSEIDFIKRVYCLDLCIKAYPDQKRVTIRDLATGVDLTQNTLTYREASNWLSAFEMGCACMLDKEPAELKAKASA